MLHIESEEEVMALLFGVGHKTNMTSARFICRKMFWEKFLTKSITAA